MHTLHRRLVLSLLAGTAACAAWRGQAVAIDERRGAFVAEAFAMKRMAEEAGDQPYGAIVVKDQFIVGWGPSRVVAKNDWSAHAEREAIRDAQARLGRLELPDCVMYSTSRPCANCERVAAEAKLARMFHGMEAHDAGRPQGR
jgi:tRNA(adenine34) deaminase